MKSRGQSLLEMVLIIGVLLIVISAVVVVTLNGLKNSQFSNNQIKATKLAQEGINKVRDIKNKNCPVEITGEPLYYWSVPPPSQSIWARVIPDSSPISFKIQANSPCLLQSIQDDSLSPTFKDQFRRVIQISGIKTNQKKIISIVSWSDFTGDHQSKLVTILSDY